MGAAALVLAAAWASAGLAQQSDHGRAGDRRGPVYQRRAFESGPAQGDRYGGSESRFATPSAPAVASGSFQRPYPYHLDYYRMRYGGSYAPYFGNLYGPPQVVTAPPYYGPYGPSYGGYGYGGLPPGYGDEGGYGPGPGWCPCEPAKPAVEEDQ